MSLGRDQVTAVVLCGGASTRMGRDKATLVPADGDPRMLGERVLDALRNVAAHALVSGSPLPGVDVPAIPDTYAAAGPLAGVAAALAAVRTDYAVVAACDMPSIVPPLLAHLLQRLQQSPDLLCVLCEGDRGLEPLLSAWRPAAAPLLDACLRGGTRALHRAIAELPHAVVPPDEWRRFDPGGACFANWNTEADLPPP